MEEINENLKIQKEFISNDPYPNSLKQKWMLELSDEKLISELSIPGTHDTGARFGTIFAQTQSWTVYDQLLAGIRYLDIRGRRVNDILTIHHGVIYMKMTFGDVLNQIEKFLIENKSETIIMRLGEGYEALNPTDTFEGIFKNTYLNNYKDLFLISRDIPTLKESRGKIVLLADFSTSLEFLKWNSLNIQDDYDLGIFGDINKKKKEIKDHMIKANSSLKNEFYANHCSAYGILLQEPLLVAEKTNSVPYEFCLNGNAKKVGIIIMDFPGEKLIEEIVNLNSKS